MTEKWDHYGVKLTATTYAHTGVFFLSVRYPYGRANLRQATITVPEHFKDELKQGKIDGLLCYLRSTIDNQKRLFNIHHGTIEQQKQQLVLRDRLINLCLIAYRKSENPNSSRKLLPTILPMWS